MGDFFATAVRLVQIVSAAFVAAYLLLAGVELLGLARWKLRRCPRCRRRLGFRGWDPTCFQRNHINHTVTLNGRELDSPWVVVTCPHCGYEIAAREAPHI